MVETKCMETQDLSDKSQGTMPRPSQVLQPSTPTASCQAKSWFLNIIKTVAFLQLKKIPALQQGLNKARIFSFKIFFPAFL